MFYLISQLRSGCISTNKETRVQTESHGGKYTPGLPLTPSFPAPGFTPRGRLGWILPQSLQMKNPDLPGQATRLQVPPPHPEPWSPTCRIRPRSSQVPSTPRGSHNSSPGEQVPEEREQRPGVPSDSSGTLGLRGGHPEDTLRAGCGHTHRRGCYKRTVGSLTLDEAREA